MLKETRHTLVHQKPWLFHAKDDELWSLESQSSFERKTLLCLLNVYSRSHAKISARKSMSKTASQVLIQGDVTSFRLRIKSWLSTYKVSLTTRVERWRHDFLFFWLLWPMTSRLGFQTTRYSSQVMLLPSCKSVVKIIHWCLVTNAPRKGYSFVVFSFCVVVDKLNEFFLTLHLTFFSF